MTHETDKIPVGGEELHDKLAMEDAKRLEEKLMKVIDEHTPVCDCVKGTAVAMVFGQTVANVTRKEGNGQEYFTICVRGAFNAFNHTEKYNRFLDGKEKPNDKETRRPN